MANFWNSTTVEPKRAYRWLMYLNDVPTYVVKVAKKPSFSVTSVPHQFVAHTFHYPGRITWDPVELTLVDPVSPDASAILAAKLQQAGYRLPTDQKTAEASFSKAASVGALGTPRITQIDAAGTPIDEWSLKNAWIERIDFGQLDYTSEEMVNMTMTLRYDYAEYSGAPLVPGQTSPRPVMVGGTTVTPNLINSILGT